MAPTPVKKRPLALRLLMSLSLSYLTQGGNYNIFHLVHLVLGNIHKYIQTILTLFLYFIPPPLIILTLPLYNINFSRQEHHIAVL